MPHLDITTFNNQLNWAIISLMFVYFVNYNCFLPALLRLKLIKNIKSCFYLNSPFEQFSIICFIKIVLLFDFSITNCSQTWIIILIILYKILLIVIPINLCLKINRLFLILLKMTCFIMNICEDNLPSFIKSNYINFFITLFNLTILANYFSLIPYTFTITAQGAFCFYLSISIWIGILIITITIFKINILSLFMPYGAPLSLSFLLVPIELISYSVRSISLGLRLCANLTAGHILLIIMAQFTWILANNLWLGYFSGILSFAPFLILLFLIILEISIAAIQSFVFILLIIIYLKDAVILH